MKKIILTYSVSYILYCIAVFLMVQPLTAKCTNNTQIHGSSNLNASFTYINQCIGDTVQFTNTSTGNYVLQHWDFGDGTETWGIDNPIHIYSETKQYVVTLTIYDSDGITDRYSQTFEIKPLPAIDLDFIGDTVFYAGGNVNIRVNGSFETYLWSTGSVENNITVTSSGAYSVKVTDEWGCTNIRTTTVRVVPLPEDVEIKIANNIITPNGDGINDRLEILNIDDFQNPCIVKVYNIWGDLVFSSSAYSNTNGWDGTNQSRLLDAGTYYFIISSKNRKGLTGYVDLIR